MSRTLDDGTKKTSRARVLDDVPKKYREDIQKISLGPEPLMMSKNTSRARVLDDVTEKILCGQNR
jgi:hypothetical protein